MHQMPSIDAFRLLRTMSDAEQAMAMTRVEAKARIRFTVAQALAQGRVSFHYQPVVRAENPRMPAFYEMLARLRLPNGQVLPAGSAHTRGRVCAGADRRTLRGTLVHSASAGRNHAAPFAAATIASTTRRLRSSCSLAWASLQARARG